MARTTMRTAGIWVENNYVLLESLADAQVWGIPGGGLEADESVAEGCLREYREELGLEMRTDGLALINENFWPAGGEAVREYCFYFWVRPKVESSRGQIDVQSREEQLQFRWFRLDDLQNIDFVPQFLPEVLPGLGKQTRFLSTSEMGASLHGG